MRLYLVRALGSFAVVTLAWLTPTVAYARCYSSDGIANVGWDEVVVILIAVALAAAALLLVFLKARRQRVKPPEDGNGDDETP